MVVAYARTGIADLAMALNGALAGLVGITAGADLVSPTAAIAIGGIAGGLVVLATWGLRLMELDDPVGAVPVHLVCGVWGTLALTCILHDCGEFPTLGVAYSVVAVISATGHGSVRSISCSDGYIPLSGAAETLSCVSGNWEMKTLVCDADECGGLPDGGGVVSTCAGKTFGQSCVLHENKQKHEMCCLTSSRSVWI